MVAGTLGVNTLLLSNLDWILFKISLELNSKFVSCDIKPGYRTDHSLVDIKFDFNQMDRRVGYWKFNNSLLTDKVFVDRVGENCENICCLPLFIFQFEGYTSQGHSVYNQRSAFF